MGLILSIDTATNVCSTSLSSDGVLLAECESRVSNSHAEVLSEMIDSVVSKAKFSLNDIDAVAVSGGPGSYTGLRIGVSTAKGICYALDKPLIAIPSLQIIAAAAKDKAGEGEFLLCPMIDARRMEVYAAMYNSSLEMVGDVGAVILDAGMFDDINTEMKIIVCGNGASKSVSVFENDRRVEVLGGIELHAKYMTKIAEEGFMRAAFEDVAYYEPFYLKEFVAGKPRVKGLR